MTKIIYGQQNNERVSSRILEEAIKQAVKAGHKSLLVKAYGQHGLGGRLASGTKQNSIEIIIEGQSGQRVGSLGYPNTTIKVMGPASDDVGWLNAGAEIIVHGNAGNGVANAMAQGKIYIAGNIGSRGMTITKHNPDFPPPELWVLGSVGDYFGEFMAGGTCVICGYNAQNPNNILGYRPLVGMANGKVFFRGKHEGFSQTDAKLTPITDQDWQWLIDNLILYLTKINKKELFDELAKRDEWQLITAYTAKQKHQQAKSRMPMSLFSKEVWHKELGKGGLWGDLSPVDRSLIPLIVTGDLRLFVPVWSKKCRDCKLCAKICPRKAISRVEKDDKTFEYVVNADKCIGCGFCENICPVAAWKLVNIPDEERE